MDCLQAQSVISEALDRSPVDSAVLEAAKTHCRECPQCGQYIRALSAVRRAVLPQPPADLVDRVMAAVRAEAATSTEASADLDEAPGSASLGAPAIDPIAGSGGAAIEAAAVRELDARPTDVSTAVLPDTAKAAAQPATGQRFSVGRSRMSRRQVVAWGSAAAVLLIVAGVSAGLGIMRLMGGGSTGGASDAVAPTAAPLASSQNLAAESPAAGAETSLGSSAKDAGDVRSAASASVYVVYKGNTYVLQGPSPQDKGQLSANGEARATFGEGTPPTARTVWTGSAAEAIYIENDAGELEWFVLVKRTYRDTTYLLRSADITEYGAWPSLPEGIPHPSPEDNPDGSPAFVFDGNDSAGTAVYRRIGADSRAGIAIAPGTPAKDPAGGNPNWTWWTP